MRLHRYRSILLRVWLLAIAAAALHGQVIVTLGSTGCGSVGAGQTCNLTARVTGGISAAVTWSFNPIVPGAITGNGSGPDATGASTNTYKAPPFITARQVVTATVTSVADPTKSASVPITLIPATITISVTPATVTLTGGQTQAFSAAVFGISETGVTWSINPLVGSIDAVTGLYTAPAVIGASQKVTVTATSAFDPAATGTATITLQPPPAVTVTVSPSSVNLGKGETQQFTATVVNGTQGVTWSVSPQIGTIDQTGLYTAPSPVSSTQKITVTATSVDDPTKAGTATVNLQATPGISVTVAPASVTLGNNQSQQFTATVQNSTAGVTWSINPQVGAIDSASGLYVAPGIISGSQRITVTATSKEDTSKTGTATITLATIVDVGTGAPANLVSLFIQAYFRNGFGNLVSLPPLGNVKRLGTTGWVQEFNDAAKTSGVKYALATVSSTIQQPIDGPPIPPIVQLYGGVYGYYTSVGANTAGYPLGDTQFCPPFDPANACQYDFFDKGYALFSYTVALGTGQNFTIRQAFYTEWTALGGMNGPGRPVDVETAVTASTGTTATVQSYAYGAIYSITSGVNKGKTFGIAEPLYDLYVNQGGAAGTLGLPTSEALQISADGTYKQTFEGGALQYTKNGGPTVQLPVVQVALSGAGSNTITLNVGQSLTVTATPMATGGIALTDRPVSWSTTNGKVIAIQANGQTAVLTAVGGGSASVLAASQGITSARLNFTVAAQCCAVGAGAPASVQQAFQDALSRNKINVQLPAQSAATRVAAGYVQMVQSADPTPVQYMLAEADLQSAAYIVTGTLLAQYQTAGGPAGALGYPASDPSAGGTQLFAAGSALAGNPVRTVSGGVLKKWAALGYEIGVAGTPTSDGLDFSTFGANSGIAQGFRGGMIYSATDGPRSGQAYFVTGLILARHNALGGAAGDYGMPVGDEFVTGGVHQQNFEGGTISYSTGDSAATERPAPKVPGIAAAPASVVAGGRAKLAAFGFPNGSTLRVSITGQPDFLVSTSNGAYSWDLAVPLTAKSGTIAIHAADTRTGASADGSVAVRGFSDNRIPIAKIQGDNQTGPPGALLPVSLRVALRDSAGNPVTGAAVTFQASSGAQLSAVGALTDESGQAETWVRLPASEGVTAITVDAPSIAQTPISFYARSAASGLTNFPKLIQAGDTALGRGNSTIGRKGALLTAVASIMRYHQNRGELPAPYGTADAEALNQFLVSYCLYDSVKGGQICDGYLSNPDSGEQIVNLWRAAEFTGGLDVVIQTPSVSNIADLIARGYPALLSLGLSLNGATAGGHFVVATGVAADGSIVIQDPNPFFGKSSLTDYLAGFSVNGGLWKAELRGVVQFARRSPGGTRFMVAALSQAPDLMKGLGVSVQSASGECGANLDLFDAVDSLGNTAPLASRIRVCDGLQSLYQIAVGAAARYRAFITDLAAGGTTLDISSDAPAVYKGSRPQLALEISPQELSFAANAVVSAATYTSGIAPGGIMTIFGSGLAAPGAPSQVAFDGTPAVVLAATPFQINAVVPSDLAPGPHVLKIASPFGSAQQTVTVSAVAPAIFLVGYPAVGAVVNQNYTLNGPTNPLTRGQTLVIYATGLGAVIRQGQLQVTATPVSVVLNGQELPATYSGLAPGAPGEYQVNVVIPPSTPPGLGVPLTLKQGGQTSNAVFVALQ